MKRCRSCWTVWDSRRQRCPFCSGLCIDTNYFPLPQEAEVLAAVQGILKSLAAPLVAELHALIQKPMPKNTHLIDFEAHPGEFRDGFAVQWDPMDAEVTQLDGGGGLLEDAPPLLPLTLFDSEEFRQVESCSIAFHALPNWFAERWKEAGGSEFAYPAFLSEHDSDLAFDLNRRLWDVQGERWLTKPRASAKRSHD